jgi:hypothetical protein
MPAHELTGTQPEMARESLDVFWLEKHAAFAQLTRAALSTIRLTFESKSPTNPISGHDVVSQYNGVVLR